MTDQYPTPKDPFAGVDPEVWQILADQQASAAAAGTDHAGAPVASGQAPPSGDRAEDLAQSTGTSAAGTGTGTGPTQGRAPAAAAVISMLALLVAAAVLDPSGLAAPIAWLRADPTALPWTWLQYVLYGPAILVLLWWSTRRLLRAATPAAPRRWVFTRVWLMVIASVLAAKAAYSAVWMAPALVGGSEAGLPADTSLPYLVWSTGFAGIKAIVVGWIPAVAAALAWRRGPAVRAGTPARAPEPTLSVLPTSLVVLGLALAGAWVGSLWWTGSPVGYAHPTGWRLLAPIPAAGRAGEVAALLLLWVMLAGSVSATLRRVAAPRAGSALVLAGVGAAIAAGLGLAVVQSLVALVAGTSVPGSDDLWILPSTFLRLVEGLSFGLLIAPVTALAVWLVPRAPRPGWTPVAVVAAVAVVAGALWIVTVQSEDATPVATLAGPDPQPVDLPPQPVAEAGVPAPPGRITVRRDADGSAVLADQSGAQVILRGVNVNQLGDYYAANPDVPTVVPLAEADFADIAAFGFNAVRLVLSWSFLEPGTGRVDQAYLADVREAIGWARENGLHVVLDMHQDAWSKDVVAPDGTVCRAGTTPMTGWDGAPAWALRDDGAPPCQFTGRDLAPNVLRSFTSFYTDRDAIQEHLVAVWGRLAREFGGDPTVVGYDLLNEPSFAEQAPLTSGMLLGRYHARAIRAIREGEAAAPGGYAHPVFLEPSIWWSGFGVDPLPPRGFTSDTQVVFAPHLYNESITMDQSVGLTTVGIERGFALAQRAADLWGVPLWSGEWGWFRGSEENRAFYERFADIEDRYRVGSAVWVWNQGCGDPHVYPSSESGNLRRYACPEQTPLATRAAEVAPLRRAYPRATPGRLLRLEASGRSLALEGSTGGAGPVDGTPSTCTLDVWVPGEAEPSVVRSEGISDLRAVSVAPGSAYQAPSGGWRVIGCATGDYRLELS